MIKFFGQTQNKQTVGTKIYQLMHLIKPLITYLLAYLHSIYGGKLSRLEYT